jgi:lysozyme
MKSKLWIILALLLLMALSVILMFYKGILRFNYPSHQQFPIQGVDISHHQGDIDWNELTTEDISFIFIKATEGGDYKDPSFQVNWTKSGAEQADNFISSVPKGEGNLPPAIDLELGGNCQSDKSDEEVIRDIQTYIDKVSAYYEQTPIIYATTEFYERYLNNQFIACPIWIRDIYSNPKLPDNRHWTFWQFANRGHLKGINGYIDLNAFNGDKTTFQSLIKNSD